MTLTAFVPMLIVTTLRARREIRTYWIPVTIGAFVANLGFLAWNVKNNWLSLAVPPASDTYTERLPRIFSGLIPRAVGLMNTNGTWTLGAFSVVLYVIVLACLQRRHHLATTRLARSGHCHSCVAGVANARWLSAARGLSPTAVTPSSDFPNSSWSPCSGCTQSLDNSSQ